MKYYQNRVQDKEGLCNQLMAVFRTLTEAFHSAGQNEPSCILLADGQTRRSVDSKEKPYFLPLPIDAFIDVPQLKEALAAKHVSLRRVQDLQEEQVQPVLCSRFLIHSLTQEESRDAGRWIAASFPFAAKPLKLAHWIVENMSLYPTWSALQMRVEGDMLLFPEIESIGLDAYTTQQIQLAFECMTRIPGLKAVYVASGIQGDRFQYVSNELTKHFPQLEVKNKTTILSLSPVLLREFEGLSLEEQALVDWLVCVGAPYFMGPHVTSFAYLAGYLRHYRGFEPDTTQLWPAYQNAWESWFPRV